VEAANDDIASIGQWPDLRELCARDGPVLSLYLTTEGDVENAAQLSERRWRNVRRELSERGADPSALERVDPLVADAHTNGRCLAVFASEDSLWHVEHGPDEPPNDIGWWDALPRLGQLVRWRQDSPPYVVVVTDRRGADLTIVRRHGSPREVSFDPDDDLPIRKSAPGGWSQRRYQQRADNTWETHARQIAEQVEHASDQVGAEIVLVGGDGRAVELLEAELPDRLTRLVEEIPGGRSADGSEQLADDAVHRWEMTAAARTTVALIERFRAERGQQDRAADGTAETFAALRRGQAQVLLLHDDWDDDRRAWFGREPGLVATDEAELRELGATDVRSGRWADVAIRAALQTSAGVWIVPSAGGPTDGIGAILRWHLDANGS
jgi:hypothetical protein